MERGAGGHSRVCVGISCRRLPLDHGPDLSILDICMDESDCRRSPPSTRQRRTCLAGATQSQPESSLGAAPIPGADLAPILQLWLARKKCLASRTAPQRPTGFMPVPRPGHTNCLLGRHTPLRHFLHLFLLLKSRPLTEEYRHLLPTTVRETVSRPGPGVKSFLGFVNDFVASLFWRPRKPRSSVLLAGRHTSPE